MWARPVKSDQAVLADPEAALNSLVSVSVFVSVSECWREFDRSPGHGNGDGNGHRVV